MSATSAKVKNRWNEEHYDKFLVTVPKGTKEVLKNHAKKKDGGSVNAFVKRAIAETLERDGLN